MPEPDHVPSPDHFPPRLAELGYRIALLNGAEVILPPMCDVPAGPFLMGSDPAEDKDAEEYEESEQPQCRVMLGAFQIAKYPVTVAEYACFIRATDRSAPTGDDLESWQVSWQTQLLERLDHPVVRVYWRDAAAYVSWLAECTGQPWRLPSEAEWEKAARWDATKGSARIYPWGDAFDSNRCNTHVGGKGGTTPVDSYPSGASPFGALDMAGNVWEWTSSVYKPYPYNASDGREGVESSDYRILRGGSWGNDAKRTRAAYRDFFGADEADGDSGFRLARARPNA